MSVLERLRRQAIGGMPTGVRRAEHLRAQRRGRLPLLLALVALLGATIALALVTLLGNLQALDLQVAGLIREWSGASATVFWIMVAVSWLGWQPQVGLIGGGLVGLLFWKRLPLEGGFTALALVTGTPVFLFLTLLAHRPRPFAVLSGIRVYQELGGTSFPSGHVITFVVFCGFAAYLAGTLVPRPVVRRALLALALAVILLIGPSRLYLGQHWFSDVLASYSIGGALLVVLVVIYRGAKWRQLART